MIYGRAKRNETGHDKFDKKLLFIAIKTIRSLGCWLTQIKSSKWQSF